MANIERSNLKAFPVFTPNQYPIDGFGLHPFPGTYPFKFKSLYHTIPINDTILAASGDAKNHCV
jgi:hypothetical protein